jgi:hypothetical protein
VHFASHAVVGDREVEEDIAHRFFPEHSLVIIRGAREGGTYS